MKKGKKISIVAIIILILLVGRACGGKNTSETKVEDQAKPETETSVAVEENEPAEVESEETTESASNNTDDGEVSAEFKEMMDSYEAFFDEYVEFMKRYNENPSDSELMLQLSSMMTKEADMLKKMEALEDNEMTTAESAYYLEVTARIYEKLASVM